MFKTLSLFAVTLTAISVALAAPTTQEITTKIGRGADASVQGGDSATKNFGTNYLWAKNGVSINFARKMYLRFDLTSAQKPLTELEKATLRLTLGAPNGASPDDKEWVFRVWGVPDGDAGEAWDEKTLNWDNAPLNAATSGKDLKETAVALGTFSILGTGKLGDVVTFSSPELATWLQNDRDKMATLVITRDLAEVGAADNVSHTFLPKEQSKQPIPTLALNFK